MDQNMGVVEKPGMVTLLTIMTLVSGVLNLFWGVIASAGIVLSTFGLGLLCVPLTILPTILGVFEIIYAVKLLSNPPGPVKPSQALAILEIVDIVFGNVISLVVGILALVLYSDPQVKAYFAQINPPPAPVQYSSNF